MTYYTPVAVFPYLIHNACWLVTIAATTILAPPHPYQVIVTQLKFGYPYIRLKWMVATWFFYLFVCVLVKHVSVIVTPIKFLNLESWILILKTGYQDSSSSNVHHLCPANSDYCPSLTPEEGHMAIRYEHTAGVNEVTAVYDCVAGYHLQQGQTGQRTCNDQSQGQWTEATPTCERELNTPYMENPSLYWDGALVFGVSIVSVDGSCRHSDDSQYLCKYIATYVKMTNETLWEHCLTNDGSGST